MRGKSSRKAITSTISQTNDAAVVIQGGLVGKEARAAVEREHVVKDARVIQGVVKGKYTRCAVVARREREEAQAGGLLAASILAKLRRDETQLYKRDKEANDARSLQAVINGKESRDHFMDINLEAAVIQGGMQGKQERDATRQELTRTWSSGARVIQGAVKGVSTSNVVKEKLRASEIESAIRIQSSIAVMEVRADVEGFADKAEHDGEVRTALGDLDRAMAQLE